MSIKTILFVSVVVSVSLAVTSVEAGPKTNVQCTKMNDGRILFDGPTYGQKARNAGFTDINNPPTYKLLKFTQTAKNDYGDVEGVCYIEFLPRR